MNDADFVECDCNDCVEARRFLESHIYCNKHDNVKGECGCD
tara:strand:- start:756 stop:878 length:123 start_codon:yes stop_codon:yes gene_type:complete